MDDGECVRVTITGVDAGNDFISLTTRGTLMDLGSQWVLQYTETNPDDLSEMKTLVQCEPERVTINRAGPFLSTLVFDMRDTFVGDYPTPFGSLQVRVYTSSLTIQRRGLFGRIQATYQVSLSSTHSPLEETMPRTLDIRFTPCRPS